MLRSLFVLMLLVPSVGFAAGDDDDDKPAGGRSAEARRKFQPKATSAMRAATTTAPSTPSRRHRRRSQVAGPYRNLGLAYRAQGRCAEALPMYENICSSSPRAASPIA